MTRLGLIAAIAAAAMLGVGGMTPASDEQIRRRPRPEPDPGFAERRRAAMRERAERQATAERRAALAAASPVTRQQRRHAERRARKAGQ